MIRSIPLVVAALLTFGPIRVSAQAVGREDAFVFTVPVKAKWVHEKATSADVQCRLCRNLQVADLMPPRQPKPGEHVPPPSASKCGGPQVPGPPLTIRPDRSIDEVTQVKVKAQYPLDEYNGYFCWLRINDSGTVIADDEEHYSAKAGRAWKSGNPAVAGWVWEFDKEQIPAGGYLPPAMTTPK